jgi:hypothetical protein
MHEWSIILLIGMASLAMCGWFARRRSGGSSAIVANPSTTEKPAQTVQSVAGPVTNTLVPPLPENEVLATLEFDGFPGHVPIRRGETVIGRHSDDDVQIRDVRVSRHHARILAKVGGDFEIQNLTAARPESNPMLVNGQDREHAAVVDGDVVTLGGVSFTFRRVADAHQPPYQRQRDNT